MKQVSTDNLELAIKELKAILEPEVEYLTIEGRELVDLAFTQMVIAHGDIRRKSG